MRAMRLHRAAPVESSPLVLEHVTVPTPAPGELLVKVAFCAVCRTDLHVIEGELPETRYPLVPGHMIVGRVVERPEGARVSRSPGISPDRLAPGGGDPAAELAPGTRVGVAWLRSTCGQCPYCASGRENLCERARFTGYHADGGYAEYATVPARWAYPIPADFSDESAAPLLCAGIIGFRALRLSGIRPGQRLGLVGFGNSAHVVAQLARARGCELVVASRGERHRSFARELGATWAGDVLELEPGSLDAAILFAPAGELVPPMLRALRRGGTLACAGIHMSPIPALDYDRELFGERVLTSVTANTRADGLELLAEAAAIPIETRTTLYPLERANEALQALKHDELQGAAVLRI